MYLVFFLCIYIFALCTLFASDLLIHRAHVVFLSIRYSVEREKKNNTHVAHKFMKLICAVYCKRETLQRRNNSNYSICNDRMQLGDGVFAFEAHASMINFNNN